jgi:hypothetical protein
MKTNLTKTMLKIQLTGHPLDHLQKPKTPRQVVPKTLVEQVEMAETTWVRDTVVAEEMKGEEEDLEIIGVHRDHRLDPTTPCQIILGTRVREMGVAQRMVLVVKEDVVVAEEEIGAEEVEAEEVGAEEVGVEEVGAEEEEAVVVTMRGGVEEGEGDNTTIDDRDWRNFSTTMLLI